MEINFRSITEQYGSPLYIYDLEQIIERIKNIKKQLSPEIKLFYAVKANSNLKLLSELKNQIDGLDISSGGEIQQAVQAGYSGEKMSFAGPGKSDQEIETALKRYCGSMSVESIDDLQRIMKIALKLKQKANIAIRINPLQLINKFAIKMGGKATQFGVDEEYLDEIVKLIKTNEHTLSFQGYHIYAGTQCLDAESLKENFEYIFAMVAFIIKKYDLPALKINVGGGLGIPYFAGQNELDLEKTLKALNSSFQKFQQEHPQTKCILELGRYIVGEAGYYITKILAIKESRNKKYLIVDGGMHQNLSASGHLGQIIKKNYKAENISSNESQLEKVDIVGCLCTPLDVLATDIELKRSAVGDLIVFYTSGAYGYTSSPLLFLGHPTPKEIMIKNHKAVLIREAKDLTSFN